jgi:acetyl-CoA carboxylase carboxyltransferase component
MGMKELVDELQARRERALAMGGPAAIAQQRAAGKLTVGERIGCFIDPDFFHEIGLLATHASISPAMTGKETPTDGVVTGFGKIHGRPASLIAHDFTVMAGSMARTAEVAFIDDVIDPRETRPVIIRALEMAATKKVERPWKKHGVMPI